MKKSFDSLGKHTRSDIIQYELSQMRESFNSHINQNSKEIAAITRKYDDQITHMKNQAEESAHAITLEIARLMTISESNFTKKLEKLDNRTRIIPALFNRHKY